MTTAPTPCPEVNQILLDVLESIQAVLGAHLAGLYLEGSLASGDFDEDSDIDFVAACDEEVSGALFDKLQVMHDRIAAGSSRWAIQLEGSYLSLRALRRHDPACLLHPNLERGRGERLKMALHDQAWDIHRHILRRRGIRLAGPPPQELVDPVAPDDLRRAIRPLLDGWAAGLLDQPALLAERGYQSYTVLTMCRALYTLETGEVAGKPAAAAWALERLGPPWNSLIERAWEGRHAPDLASNPADVRGTLELIRLTMECSKRFF